VTVISDAAAVAEMARRLETTHPWPQPLHSTAAMEYTVSPRENHLLELVTQEERAMLAPYYS